MHSYCGLSVRAQQLCLTMLFAAFWLAARVPGGQTLQGHEFVEFPAAATLRHLGRSLLPDGELLSVEASKEIDGKPEICLIETGVSE